jgi:trypsin
MLRVRSLILTLLFAGVIVAPAQAVVGGEKIAPTDVPWFTFVGPCGGTLVAPDRILTAAHCVADRSPDDLGQVQVNGQLRDVTGIALHPDWRHRNGNNYDDDVALVRLSAPVTGVVPVQLGGVAPAQARIIGAGLAYAPGTGHSEAEMLNGGLRQASLRLISDKECGKAFKDYKAADGETFNAARMLCAIDADGKAPLSSGCNGDSGGPFVAGANDAPVVLGVVSWGGDRCGADHLPSVFAEVDRYRAFITDPTPTWAPTRKGTVKISGKHTLTCKLTTPREPGTKLQYVWKRLPRWGQPVKLATGSRYTPEKGQRVGCFAYASNDGGELLAGVDNVQV